jgi:hypothetical protein
MLAGLLMLFGTSSLRADDRSIFEFKKILEDNGFRVSDIKIREKSSYAGLVTVKTFVVVLKAGGEFEIVHSRPTVVKDLTLLLDRKSGYNAVSLYGLSNPLKIDEYYARVAGPSRPEGLSDPEKRMARDFLESVRKRWDNVMSEVFVKNGAFHLCVRKPEKKEFLVIGEAALKDLDRVYRVPSDLKDGLMRPARTSIASGDWERRSQSANAYNRKLPSEKTLKRIVELFELW